MSAAETGPRPGTIVQFGSGHPGEEGSGHFEAALFEELRLSDPNILFFPFHTMPPDTGDLALFKRIYGPLTKGWIESVQLHPPRFPENPTAIHERIEEADVVVLGSGFPEPFIHLMERLGLPARLRARHRRGATFLGYSAGSLALGAGYYMPFTGEDLLIQMDLLDHISMPDARRTEMEEQLCAVLDREDAREFVDGVRARLEGKQRLDQEQATFFHEPLWIEEADGFRLTPGVTANPHYGERFQYREVHLRHLGRLLPDLLHVGIPNGCALVTRWEDGEVRSTFRGRNPRRQAACLAGSVSPRRLRDGDPVLPAPPTGAGAPS